MTARITQLDTRVIERVLDTGRGADYVLDFSDADFGDFLSSSQRSFERLAVVDSMSKLLISRMKETSRCLENRAFLAVIILCGSIREGMSLGYEVRNPEAVNRVYVAQYSKAAPPFYDWKLAGWIEVLGRIQVQHHGDRRRGLPQSVRFKASS